MESHAAEVIPFLLWIIVAVGSCLLSLIVWVGNRLNKKVDDMPAAIALQVEHVHSGILEKLDKMGETHEKLERDVRDEITQLDRRVVRLEVSCSLHHDRDPR